MNLLCVGLFGLPDQIVVGEVIHVRFSAIAVKKPISKWDLKKNLRIRHILSYLLAEVVAAYQTKYVIRFRSKFILDISRFTSIPKW